MRAEVELVALQAVGLGVGLYLTGCGFVVQHAMVGAEPQGSRDCSGLNAVDHAAAELAQHRLVLESIAVGRVRVFDQQVETATGGADPDVTRLDPTCRGVDGLGGGGSGRVRLVGEVQQLARVRLPLTQAVLGAEPHVARQVPARST